MTRAAGRFGAGVVVTIGALLLCSTAHAQAPSAEANLAAGISEIRSGDFLRAVFTLNDVVAQLADRPDASAMLARAHAYRAEAYIELEQPERAMAAALLALKANPKIVVSPPDFSPAVAKLFADPAGFVAAKPPAAAPKTETPMVKAAPAAPAAAPAAATAMATIYVYRPGAYVGKLGKAKVLCDGRTIAELQNDRYFTVTAAPGTHDMKFGGTQIPLVADAGRTYYIEVRVAGFSYSAKFVNADQGALEIRQNKLKLNDAARTFGTECGASPAKVTLRK